MREPACDSGKISFGTFSICKRRSLQGNRQRKKNGNSQWKTRLSYRYTLTFFAITRLSRLIEDTALITACNFFARTDTVYQFRLQKKFSFQVAIVAKEERESCKERYNIFTSHPFNILPWPAGSTVYIRVQYGI